MAKYFFDTEFIEGFKKPVKWLPTIGKFNKAYHSIQLVSIGICCDDGREYYAISNEYDPADANDWVKKHVLTEIFCQACDYPAGICAFEKYQMKSNAQIAREILDFVYNFNFTTGSYTTTALAANMQRVTPIEFYGYFSDYDWVLFCSLFGAMKDLPELFPMYCKDLKQLMDDKIESLNKRPSYANDKWTVENLQKQSSFPVNDNEHNAMSDARWSLKLYRFLMDF